MPERFNSIKYKLLTGFLILTLNTVFLSSFSFYYFKRAEKIRTLKDAIYELHIQLLQLMKIDNDFLNFGIINNEFYKSNKSEPLDQRKLLFTLIRQKQQLIEDQIDDQKFDLGKDLNAIDSIFNKYNSTFDIILVKIIERGFRDYGLEGRLREYAHLLEKEESLRKEQILSLRRNEKDYFLRNDPIYSIRVDSICNLLLSESEDNGNSNLYGLLTNYKNTFKKLSAVQEEIGFYNDNGLKSQLKMLKVLLDNRFTLISNYSNKRVESIIDYGTYIYILTVVFSITITVVTSYWIASKLSKPIRKLSSMMDRFVSSRIKEDKKLFKTKNKAVKSEFNGSRKKLKRLLFAKEYNNYDEIRTLSDSFINLIHYTKDQFREIQEKSELLKTQNQELKKINVELDRFVYSAAHDLRSPLTSLLGLIQLLEIEEDREMIQAYLSHMKKSIHKLDSFIKDIVDYSKNNRVEINIEEINIREIINSCFEVQQFVPGTENLRRTVKINGTTPFLSDKRRLTIILNNFISNGLRYFDPNKPCPFLEIKFTVNQVEAQLTIEDNGIGIEEEEIENIFKMFYRASESSKGSGLGLFIVKESIDKLQGKITVKSKLGSGTKFTITLPNYYPQNTKPKKTGDKIVDEVL